MAKYAVSGDANEAGEATASPNEPTSVKINSEYDDHDNNDDIEISEDQHRNRNYEDHARPGAYHVAGFSTRQGSQQTFVYGGQDGAASTEHDNLDDNSADAGPVVAKVVNEDDLFQEILTLRRICATKKRTIAVATVLLAVVVVVVVTVAVLVTRPTAGPVTLQEAFRSILLSNEVSSSEDLDQSGTPQNAALNWLVNDHFLNETSPEESIIERYALTVIYYTDVGKSWTNQSNFLTFRWICAWHDSVKGSGAFCTTSMNGNYVSVRSRQPFLTAVP
jgi:hypothetical protein